MEKIQLLMILNRFEDARESIKTALQLELTDTIMLNNIAFFLYRLGESMTGLNLIRKVLAKEPNDARFLDTLACILSGMRQNEESLKIFQKASELRKNNDEITWKEFANVYEKLQG